MEMQAEDYFTYMARQHDDGPLYLFDKAFADLLDEVIWTDNMHQGYVRLVLAADSAKADFVAVRTVLQPDQTTRIIRSFTLLHDGISIALIDPD